MHWTTPNSNDYTTLAAALTAKFESERPKKGNTTKMSNQTSHCQTTFTAVIEQVVISIL